jgi:hypothetical protein
MHLVARRDKVDATAARTLEPSREHDVRLATDGLLVQPEIAAEVELVAIRKTAPALRTHPQRLHRAQLTITW